MTPHQIVNRYELLRGERKNLDYQWEIIERFVMPGKGRFFQEGFDQEESINWRHRELYDQTATQALITLAAALHSSLTSPSTRWFNLRFRQPELNDSKVAKEWLEECGNRMADSLNESNFNLEVNELYQDVCGFGTSVMYHEEREEGATSTRFGGHAFATPMAREIYFEEDWNGHAVALYRRRQYTAQQLKDKFDTLPEHLNLQLDSDKANEKHDVIHAIYPKDYGDTELADRGVLLSLDKRPFESKYILYEGHHQLGKTGGYHELPAYAVRWSRTAGSKFGHSPAIVCLSDIMTLNQLVEVVHQSVEKVVDPPMKQTQRGVLSDLELFAGGLNVVRTQDALQPLMDPRSYRIDMGFADMEDIRTRVNRAFFVDQLELKESPQMTATEVMARMELMQRLLGPTLTRLQVEFLDPLIHRTFWMMNRKGALPSMPDMVGEYQGEYEVDYLGPLAKAQRRHEVDAIERWTLLLAQIAQIAGEDGLELFDKVDFPEVATLSAKIIGVPAKVVRNDEDAKVRRDQRKSQMDAMRQAEAMSNAASGLADVGSATKDISDAATLQ